MEIAPGVHHLQFALRPEMTGSMNLLAGSNGMGMIDTGTPPQPDQTLLPYLAVAGLDPAGITTIVNTHWHADHMGGNYKLLNMSHARVAVHRLDAPYLENPYAAVTDLKSRYGRWHPNFGQDEAAIRKTLPPASRVDRVLEDGEFINVGGFELQVIHTPGHTAGSICLYDRATRTLFSGDSLQGDGHGGGLALYTDVAPYIAALTKLDRFEIEMLVTAHLFFPAKQDVYKDGAVRDYLRVCRAAPDLYNNQLLEVVRDARRPLHLGDATLGLLAKNGLATGIDLGAVATTNAHLEYLLGLGLLRTDIVVGEDGTPERLWAASDRRS
ncbi:MAG: MBL fold metallo-hydrolase [Chloroflexi bacterium]|nr:MBL fold metallo-hydrolase [Chloroflexota bacterium]